MKNPTNDIDIEEHPELERRLWIAERIGWCVMALIMLAAAAGLFGRGLLGTASAEAQSMSVEYYRFWRSSSPMTLRIHLSPETAEGGEVRVWLGREYLEKNRLEQVTPQPDRVEAGSDRYTYVFKSSPLAEPTAVTYTLSPEVSGRVRGEAGVGTGQRVEFSHFIFP